MVFDCSVGFFIVLIILLIVIYIIALYFSSCLHVSRQLVLRRRCPSLVRLGGPPSSVDPDLLVRNLAVHISRSSLPSPSSWAGGGCQSTSVPITTPHCSGPPSGGSLRFALHGPFGGT